MKTCDFDYYLPQKLIAQEPIQPRDHSKLMIINKKENSIHHDYFYNLDKYLTKKDVLVFNESKVIPARLFGQKTTGGKVEILLHQKISTTKWEALTKPGIKNNQKIIFSEKLEARVVNINPDGTRILKFNKTDIDIEKIINQIGIMPTPPYITKRLANNNDYQTIYAKNKGSVAAPTAGFHFTKELFENLKSKDINTEFLTLHVGLGTFQPIKTKEVKNHQMHSEWFEISKKLTQKLNNDKKQKKNIVAVGTTSCRALESATNFRGELKSFSGKTEIFIYPGYEFKFVDKLITNFHLPKSTLLLLVSAFAGQELIQKAYQEAINHNYRFYSFGDGMLIL